MKIAYSLVLFFLISIFPSAAKSYEQKDSSKVSSDAKYTRFMILTKECKHCKDEFKITLLVNDTIYLNTLATDSVFINIPDAKPNDIITIKKYKYHNHSWDCQRWINNREYRFKIKNKPVICLKSTCRVKSNFHYKKGDAHYM